MSHEARCSCGELRVICEGAPVRVSMCHCLACQRRTGSVFGVQSRWRTDQVATFGTPREFTRIGDSGKPVTFSFCGTCGTTLWWRLARDEGLIAVAVGGFADPSFPPPKVVVYEECMHPWTAMPALVGAEHHL